jgi:hypothetical protein
MKNKGLVLFLCYDATTKQFVVHKMLLNGNTLEQVVQNHALLFPNHHLVMGLVLDRLISFLVERYLVSLLSDVSVLETFRGLLNNPQEQLPVRYAGFLYSSRNGQRPAYYIRRLVGEEALQSDLGGSGSIDVPEIRTFSLVALSGGETGLNSSVIEVDGVVGNVPYVAAVSWLLFNSGQQLSPGLQFGSPDFKFL